MSDLTEQSDPDPAALAEQVKEAVSKIRGMAEDLKSVIEHEGRVVDELKQHSVEEQE